MIFQDFTGTYTTKFNISLRWLRCYLKAMKRPGRWPVSGLNVCCSLAPAGPLGHAYSCWASGPVSLICLTDDLRPPPCPPTLRHANETRTSVTGESAATPAVVTSMRKRRCLSTGLDKEQTKTPTTRGRVNTYRARDKIETRRRQHVHKDKFGFESTGSV